MKTALIAVGKLRPAFRQACDDYLARLGRFGPITEREVKEAPASKSGPEQIRDEGQKLLAAIPESSMVVVLHRAGIALASEELAGHLDRWRQAGRTVVLVLGGSLGLDQRVVDRAAFRWSLGPLTLPHELARVVALEQWYRAWTILRGEKYHK